ncbi:unnamed protein product [Urochloa humidicola]
METMEEMMERMKLSEAEKKGIRVEKTSTMGAKSPAPQAVGKVLAEKLAHADGIAQTLGRIWCPIKGINCKDLGENHFLFTFLQAAGKRRAMEDGPWMFGKDLVVVAEVDESKSIEEMEFAYIPIWVRVMKLPFGMMNKATGEAIGAELGSFVDMDLDDDGTAVGRYLRIKVRLDIRKPLMRGVTVFVGEKEDKHLWCPLEYEFLPDFCYTCGIIGHTDKICEKQLAPGEIQIYSKSLRCMLSRRRGEEGGDRASGGKQLTNWKSWGSGSGNQSRASSGKLVPSRCGSDAPSWRKDVALKGDAGGKATGKEEEEEVTSPLKLKDKQLYEGLTKKVLFVEKEKVANNVAGKQEETRVLQVAQNKAVEASGKGKVIDVNSTMQDMHVDDDRVLPADDGEKEILGTKEKGSRRGTYKKLPRDIGHKDGAASSLPESRKRSLNDEANVGVIVKKVKANETIEKAGLSEQPCQNQ